MPIGYNAHIVLISRLLIVELLAGALLSTRRRSKSGLSPGTATLRMLVGSSSETPRRSAGAGGWYGGGCWLTPVAE